MSTHKHFDRICCIIFAAVLLISFLFINGEAFGIKAAAATMGYENRIFDTSRVHTIDIVMDDWDSFLETCTDEEYSSCAVVIDGEAYKNIAIRAKGNTSLSSVQSYGNNRYSFKIEFDHYDSSITYHGLDKLCLNNIIQDNTFMKDYIVYRMMNDMGVSSPLVSFCYITVNGEDWGLYLAVEAIEESFLKRNYGNDYGDLYKPDSMSFGGGRGNGKDFSMSDFMDSGSSESDSDEASESDFRRGGRGNQNNFDFSLTEEQIQEFADSIELPEGMELPDLSQIGTEEFEQQVQEFAEQMKDNFTNSGKMDFGGMGGGMSSMGSDDVKLQYIDDDPDSYSNIFDSAKTDVTEADQTRLIASLKTLSEGGDVTSVVNVEDVISYFVVHNFVCNGDSYTGSMIHNYYLYEENGELSMLPWDYNLAFGGFDSHNATDTVNTPIDSPVSGGIGEDRPMVSWIFESEEYTALYHEYFSKFISEYFDSGVFTEIIDEAYNLIAPYVEKDPTKFCTYEEFEKGYETLREFCLLRAESVREQLNGTIPSTTDGQNADPSAYISASHITISDMGSMNVGGGNMGGSGGNKGSRNTENRTADTSEGTITAQMSVETGSSQSAMPDMNSMPEGFGNGEVPEMPEGGFGGQMPEGFGNGEVPEMPEGGFGGQMSEGFGNSEAPETSENGLAEQPDESSTEETPAQTTADTSEADEAVPSERTQQIADSESGTAPEKPDNSFGGQKTENGNMPSAPSDNGFSMGGTAQDGGSSNVILLAASAVVLIGGIIFAALYKR